MIEDPYSLHCFERCIIDHPAERISGENERIVIVG